MSHGRSAPELSSRSLLEEDAEDLYEHAPCGYVSTLCDGTIVKVNGTFVNWTGYARDTLLGKRFPDVLTVGGQIFHETHLAPLLRMQGFVREIALEVLRADGTRLPVLVNAALRAGAAGPEVVRLTVFDATDRRSYERELLRARQKAEEAAAARARLLSMISHDVRAPLSAILTAAAMLEKSEPAERQMRFIRVLRSSSEQALALVNSMLELGRLEAGQTTLRERPFELQTVVHDVVAGVALVAEHKPELSVQVSVDERIPRALVGDPDRLGQILTNLLTNAVKFTERGFVSLAVVLRDVDPEAATVEVAVTDTGIGIPADRLDHIFDEYTQASSEIGERYGGSGLGLAITRRLLLLHGSELRVTSTVGQGTTFSFVLRLRRGSTGQPQPA